MSWLTEDQEGKDMERDISLLINSFLMGACCLLLVVAGTEIWLLFDTEIKTALRAAEMFVFG